MATCVLAGVVLTACSSGPSPSGSAAGHPGHSAAPAPPVSTTTTVVSTSAGEAAYKNSSEAVTIGQLVSGRINAPTFSVGADVTFSGTIQGLLRHGSGELSGLVLEDPVTSATIDVELSSRASADASETPNFLNPADVVTVWGSWEAAGSIDNFPQGVTHYPAVVDEEFLTDSTTGTSDSIG